MYTPASKSSAHTAVAGVTRSAISHLKIHQALLIILCYTGPKGNCRQISSPTAGVPPARGEEKTHLQPPAVGLHPPASAPLAQAMEQACQGLPPKAEIEDYRKDTLAKCPDPSCSVQPTLARETNISALTLWKRWQTKTGVQREHSD